MVDLDDTIAAVSTPAGASPVAIVRLSGPAAFPILQGLLAAPVGELAAFPPYSACEASLRLRRGGPRVPATLYLMRAPRSYTRQDVAEVHTLGSPPLVRLLLDALVERGARIAEPGEFTRRAFLAGRLDLAQAEAVLAVIQATTAGESRAAARALQGHASRHIRRLHDSLLALRAQVEASMDFAEHDIELISRPQLLDALQRALADVADQLRSADAGALPPEGIRVALCGLPNAGKSSLFNALLGRDRAIVTPVPGTTRDAIAEPLAVEGVRFRLYDTAGLAPDCGMRNADCGFPPDPSACTSTGVVRADAVAASGHASRGTHHASAAPALSEGSSRDAVELEAIARSRGLIAGTHIALVVLDASQPLGDPERGLWSEIQAPHKLLVLNKSDLPTAIPEGTFCFSGAEAAPPAVHPAHPLDREQPVDTGRRKAECPPIPPTITHGTPEDKAASSRRTPKADAQDGPPSRGVGEPFECGRSTPLSPAIGPVLRTSAATGAGLAEVPSSSHASRVTRHASPVLHVSALTGAGIPELRTALAGLVRSGRVDASPADLVWNARHREALRRAREALERALAAARDDLGAEFVAADLRDAHDALGAITGQVVAEDLLDLIFAQFCIGK